MSFSKTFSKGEAVRFGWKIAKENIAFWIVVVMIAIVFDKSGAMIEKLLDIPEKSFTSFGISFIQLLISIFMYVGMIRISLQFYDQKQPQVRDLFSGGDVFLKAIVGEILYILMILCGLILLIVPGIIWSLQYQFVIYLIADRGMGPFEAFKESSRLSKGVKGNLFVFWLILLGIVLLGALALLVGLLWAIPTVYLAHAFVYRKLVEQSSGEVSLLK